MASNQDKLLDDYLAGRDGLSRRYADTGRDEPSSAMDKAILNAARDAVPGKPGGVSPFGGNWFVPVSLAAVLVLTVGIAITMEREVGIERYEADQYQPSAAKPAPELKKEKRQAPATQTKKLRNEPESLKLTTDKEEEVGRATPGDAQTVPKRFRQPAEPVPVAEPNALQDTAPATTSIDESAPAAPEQMPAERDVEMLREEAVSGFKADEAKPQAAEKWLESIRELIQQNRLEEAKSQLDDFRRIYPDYPLEDEFKLLFK